jgi:hypothetical protein
LTGSLPSGATFVDNGGGIATLSGTPAAGSGGEYHISITATNGVATAAVQNFLLKVNQPLSFSSAATGVFKIGLAQSFTVTTAGYPTPRLSATGSLPGGVSFVHNGNGTGTLSGTPAIGSNQTYSITFTATDPTGLQSTVNQTFSLLVGEAPVFASGLGATFTSGTAGSFTVSVTGLPTPTLTEQGALPTGVTFVNNGNGTATLAGTPVMGARGSYPLTFTAANGVGPNVQQSFTLTVLEAPVFTSAPNGAFETAQVQHFLVTTTGNPLPRLTVSNTLPSGITFTDNGDGTGVFTGAAPNGSYPVTITATNSVSTTAQNFTLSVRAAPAIAISASNPWANQVTLLLNSSASGKGYLTLLHGSNAACGNGEQVKAGTDSNGVPAYARGSLALTGGIAGNYTVRNLASSSSYTACFTADDAGALQSSPAAVNLTTTAAPSQFESPSWSRFGSGTTGAHAISFLAFAPDGTPYRSYDSSNTIWVEKYDGSSWSNVGAGITADGPYNAPLAFAPDGTLYIAYRDSVGGAHKLTVKKYDGSNWVTVGNAGFSGSLGDDSGYRGDLSLTVDPDGVPYVAFRDVSNSEKVTVMRYDGSAWATVNTEPNPGRYPKVMIAPSGTLYLGYLSGNTATVRKYDGSSWTTLLSASVPTADYCSQYCYLIGLALAP